MKALKFQRENMEKILDKGFSNATELADSLVLEGGLSFRQAHKIVGGAISELFQNKKGQEELTWELLDRWSRDICGSPLPMSREQIEKAKDFRTAVERRNCQGATAPVQVLKMLEHQKESLVKIHQKRTMHREHWKQAEKELHQKAENLINSH